MGVDMRPVKNEFKGYFQVGEYLNQHKERYTGQITGMELCENSSNCQEQYKNFHVCGGKVRLLDHGRTVCCFFRCWQDDHMLTGSYDGAPLQ